MTSELKKNASIEIYSLNEQLDAMAFFLGSEADTSNANEVSVYFNTLLKIKAFLIGEKVGKEEVLDEITDMIYYIGCDITPDNVMELKGFIQTLYSAKEIIKSL